MNNIKLKSKITTFQIQATNKISPNNSVQIKALIYHPNQDLIKHNLKLIT